MNDDFSTGRHAVAAGKGHQGYLAVSIEGERNSESIEGARAHELKRESNRTAQENIELIEVAGGENGAGDNERPTRRKWSLLDKVSWEWDEYDDIQRKVTAKALMNDEENPLLLAIKVTEQLHERASRKEPNEDNFIDLANRVEEFTLRFLDPLKDRKRWREDFAFNPKTDIILETAIKLEQKKFFDHPIIMNIINERWHGDRRISFKESKLWWLFLNTWCILDVVLFPLSFFLAFAAGWMAARVSCLRSFFQRRLFFLGEDEVKSTCIYKRYKDFFTLPYFIFVRDTLSYLALLGLHLAICFEPSQLTFSGLEWAILVFLFGRLLMEIKQITRLVRSEDEGKKSRALTNYYFRDRWNYFDFAILFTFFCAITPLRIVTWVESESVTDNRILEIAGYLYGLNTMLLTLRVFGSILEAFEGVGTIQIALFQIIRDAAVVVLHFGAITLAFSSTIMKVFVVETSIVDEETKKNLMCNKTGIVCWWRITTHLGWSVLQLSDGLDFFKSAGSLSETLVHQLFAAYLVMAVILLINMLIALLSNTYQRVQDNSRKEWAFQNAVTIQTYSNYHPIPVPFNILSTLVMCCCFLRKKWKADEAVVRRERHAGLNYKLNLVVANLQHKYRLKYGDSFPPTDKLDKVIDDAENTEGMVNQVLYRTFTKQHGCDKALLPTGSKAWETSRHALVEGFLLTATNNGSARYRTAFSHRFPHFEVMVLESGVSKWFALGVVFEDYAHPLPGKVQGTLGYHTGERTIWSADAEGVKKTATKGPGAARRGDVIRCTVMFEDMRERDGTVEVPVVFTVNGSRIVSEGGPTNIEYNADRPLYPQIGFYYENSVLAKMCPREDVDFQDLQMQELKSDLSEVKSELVDVCKQLISTKQDVVRHEVKSDLAIVHEDLQIQEVKSELECEFTQMKSDLAKMKSNLDDVCKNVMSPKEGVVRFEVKSDLADVHEDLKLQEVKVELAEVKYEIFEVKRSLEDKLNAVLAKLDKKEINGNPAVIKSLLATNAGQRA